VPVRAKTASQRKPMKKCINLISTRLVAGTGLHAAHAKGGCQTLSNKKRIKIQPSNMNKRLIPLLRSLLILQVSVATVHAIEIVDFEGLNHNDSGTVVDAYLAGFGIRVTTDGRLLAFDDRAMIFPPPSTPIVQASSGHMFLAAAGPTVAGSSFTLSFEEPLSRFAFTRIWHTGNNSGPLTQVGWPQFIRMIQRSGWSGRGPQFMHCIRPTSLPRKSMSSLERASLLSGSTAISRTLPHSAQCLLTT